MFLNLFQEGAVLEYSGMRGLLELRESELTRFCLGGVALKHLPALAPIS